MANATAPPASLQCPDWCNAHQTANHPEDETHVAEFVGGFMLFCIYEYLINPQPHCITGIVVGGEVGLTADDVRKLGRTAAAAADTLKRLTGDAA